MEPWWTWSKEPWWTWSLAFVLPHQYLESRRRDSQQHRSWDLNVSHSCKTHAHGSDRLTASSFDSIRNSFSCAKTTEHTIARIARRNWAAFIVIVEWILTSIMEYDCEIVEGSAVVLREEKTSFVGLKGNFRICGEKRNQIYKAFFRVSFVGCCCRSISRIVTKCSRPTTRRSTHVEFGTAILWKLKCRIYRMWMSCR
jgi:hypothetical protein